MVFARDASVSRPSRAAGANRAVGRPLARRRSSAWCASATSMVWTVMSGPLLGRGDDPVLPVEGNPGVGTDVVGGVVGASELNQVVAERRATVRVEALRGH